MKMTIEFASDCEFSDAKEMMRFINESDYRYMVLGMIIHN